MPGIPNWLSDLFRPAPPVGARFEVFPDESGQWRWHLRAGNNRLIACGGEGFAKLGNAKRSVALFRSAVDAPIMTLKHPSGESHPVTIEGPAGP